jgi:hypothetical protein
VSRKVSFSFQRTCACCREAFTPAASRKAVQRFCAKAVCRKASKAASQRRWTQRNPDYFKGAEHVDRVKRWRARNPGRKRAARLQEIAPQQVAQKEPLATGAGASPGKFVPGREAASADNAGLPGLWLQDLAQAQTPLLVGFISAVMGGVLQDDLPAVTRQLVERGRRVLSQVPGWEPSARDAAA